MTEIEIILSWGMVNDNQPIQNRFWLVVWLPWIWNFPRNIGNAKSSQLTNSNFFQRGGYTTTNQSKSIQKIEHRWHVKEATHGDVAWEHGGDHHGNHVRMERVVNYDGQRFDLKTAWFFHQDACCLGVTKKNIKSVFTLLKQWMNQPCLIN